MRESLWRMLQRKKKKNYARGRELRKKRSQQASLPYTTPMLQRHKAFGQAQGIALGIASSGCGGTATGVAHAPSGRAALQRSLQLRSQAATQ